MAGKTESQNCDDRSGSPDRERSRRAGAFYIGRGIAHGESGYGLFRHSPGPGRRHDSRSTLARSSAGIEKRCRKHGSKHRSHRESCSRGKKVMRVRLLKTCLDVSDCRSTKSLSEMRKISDVIYKKD